jgi:predicted RND superfamily exporter protein
VVNASIVMIDRYNINRNERGLNPEDAIAEAAARRFRPVLITTLTTALGLLPIISEQSPQAQFLVPMAVSLGAGLMFAAVSILMLLPAFVMIVEMIRKYGAPVFWSFAAIVLVLAGQLELGILGGLIALLLVAGAAVVWFYANRQSKAV